MDQDVLDLLKSFIVLGVVGSLKTPEGIVNTIRTGLLKKEGINGGRDLFERESPSRETFMTLLCQCEELPAKFNTRLTLMRESRREQLLHIQGL